MATFKINHLDHVAIYVKDMNASAAWYQRVLGLQKVHPERWQPYPIFMLAGTTGLAIFPEKATDIPQGQVRSSIRIDHFAFNVSAGDFETALAHYHELGLTYQVKHHHYFRSVYTKDLDGHIVELTTLVVAWEDFING